MKDPCIQLFRVFQDAAQNWRQTVYIYRLNNLEKPETPYLFKAVGFFDDDIELIEYIRQEFGSGRYKILVRDGSTMVFSGEIGVLQRRA